MSASERTLILPATSASPRNNLYGDMRALQLLQRYILSLPLSRLPNQPSDLDSEDYVRYQAVIYEFIKKLLESTKEETLLPVDSLLTSSTIKSFHIGTGLQITNLILTELLKSAEQEIIFITCFWADSPSLKNFSKVLVELNRLHARTGSDRKLQVKIGFSSLSLLQKLFQPSTKAGKTYNVKSRSQCKKLGLPPPEAIPNLSLEIKSIFYRPVSVLHGKYVIVDRKTLYLPSCNVSWEEWAECMAIYEGEIVGTFFRYWEGIWRDQYIPEAEGDGSQSSDDGNTDSDVTENSRLLILQPLPPLSITFDGKKPFPTIFAPQPHHATLPPIPFISSLIAPCLPSLRPTSTPPPTPQNIIIPLLLQQATFEIYIQTPNLTSTPLLETIYQIVTDRTRSKLKVEIVTCKKMMVVEQLVTTGFGGAHGEGTSGDDGEGPGANDEAEQFGRRWGATTESCIVELLRRIHSAGDEGALGRLKLSYFNPRPLPEQSEGTDANLTAYDQLRLARQSHIKALIIDNEAVMLGSANGDRASWFTSGEVNVIVIDKAIGQQVRELLRLGLSGNLQTVNDPKVEG